jgi:hypothetical protein
MVKLADECVKMNGVGGVQRELHEMRYQMELHEMRYLDDYFEVYTSVNILSSSEV